MGKIAGLLDEYEMRLHGAEQMEMRGSNEDLLKKSTIATSQSKRLEVQKNRKFSEGFKLTTTVEIPTLGVHEEVDW